MRGRGIDPARLYLGAALGLGLWVSATFLWHFTFGHGRTLASIQFLDQDFPVLWAGLLVMALAAPFARSPAGGDGWRLPAPTARVVLPLIALFALTAWAGHYLLFQDYLLSRDEEVSRFAAAYMREGLLARPIPEDWVAYRRAIMPEFFAPFGATAFWASAYLPVNSLIQSLFWRLGDPDLASPALLALGLLAMWRAALRLFPDRPDAVWVTLLLGFTSTQLWVTAMTPYAMTGHFALNMVWLALLLRGGWLGHAGAGVTALVAAGLHQWHFPPIFIAPFIAWLLLQRRWGAAAFHILVLAAIVVLWAKLWPAFLTHELGLPADVRPSAGVADKVGSLFGRLGEKWMPLVNLSRLLAWNNLLMVPLAVVGIATMGVRNALTGRTVALPLGLGAIAGCVLALAQGYGWGYRYGHGFIGPLCLLAGYGWMSLKNNGLRPIAIASLLCLLTLSFMVWRTHAFVAPYARSDRMIQAAPVDVVLVDPRGGLFVTDLVRGNNGIPGHPMVMNLGMLSLDGIRTLCANYRVALFDRTDFRPAGVPLARWQRSRQFDALRRYMTRIDCDKPVRPLPQTMGDAFEEAGNAL